MSDLSRDASALLRAGRDALRPNGADRDRVFRSLTAALGQSSASAEISHPLRVEAASPVRATMKGWLLRGLAVITLGTGAVTTANLWPKAPSRGHAAPPERSSPATPAPAVEPTPWPASSLSEITPTPEQAGLEPSAPKSVSGSAREHVLADALSEEVRLLSRAQRQMSDGRHRDAWKTLAEHGRRFPAGGLAEERMAARVQAWCALGDTAEAKSELAKLARAYPRSAHIEGARRICGIAPGAP